MIMETPCIVLIWTGWTGFAAYAEICQANHCKLRPHTKTHKIPELAQLQLDYGAAGITVAKLSEAETMAQGGIRDIFMAYPLIGAHRIQRAIALAKSIRLICAADCYESAQLISQACVEAGIQMELRLEVDTGMGPDGNSVCGCGGGSGADRGPSRRKAAGDLHLPGAHL